MKISLNTTGRRIAFHRKMKDVKQEDFASSLNVTQSKVSDWENDHRSPTVDELIKIANLLEIHPYDLIPVEQPISHREYKTQNISFDAAALELQVNIMNEVKAFYNKILNPEDQTIEIVKIRHNLKQA